MISPTVAVVSQRHSVSAHIAILLGHHSSYYVTRTQSLADGLAAGYDAPRLASVDVLRLFSAVPNFPPRFIGVSPGIIVVGFREDSDAMIAAWSEGIPAYVLEDLKPATLKYMLALPPDDSRLYDFICHYSARGVYRFLASRFERQVLTPQEQSIVELLRRGHRNSHIARDLGIEPKTVKNHLTHVYQKLGVSSRYELLAGCS